MNQDEKCALVARYLYIYPEGRDAEEHKKIKTFFKSSEKSNLADKVRSYYQSYQIEPLSIFLQISDLRRHVYRDLLHSYNELWDLSNRSKKKIIERSLSKGPGMWYNRIYYG